MTQKTRYIHLRVYDKDYNTNPFGGFTIGYILNTAENTIKIAYSRVHLADRYTRKIGRSTVDVKLAGTQYLVLTGPDVARLCYGFVSRLSPEAINRFTVDDFSWSALTDILTDYIGTIIQSLSNTPKYGLAL